MQRTSLPWLGLTPKRTFATLFDHFGRLVFSCGRRAHDRRTCTHKCADKVCSLLLINEPVVGKSAVVSSAARELQRQQALFSNRRRRVAMKGRITKLSVAGAACYAIWGCLHVYAGYNDAAEWAPSTASIARPAMAWTRSAESLSRPIRRRGTLARTRIEQGRIEQGRIELGQPPATCSLQSVR
jgi:hypothetical protein